MAERALTLQPNLSEAHVALGTVYYYGYRQYEQALTEFSRAVELQPTTLKRSFMWAMSTGGRVSWSSLWKSSQKRWSRIQGRSARRKPSGHLHSVARMAGSATGF